MLGFCTQKAVLVIFLVMCWDISYTTFFKQVSVKYMVDSMTGVPAVAEITLHSHVLTMIQINMSKPL